MKYCKLCHTKEIYGVTGYCLECLEIKRQTILEKYEQQKAKKKSRYAECKAKHLCIDCLTPVEGSIRCRECADKRNAVLKKYRATHNRAKYTEEERRARWQANGLLRATITNAKRKNA